MATGKSINPSERGSKSKSRNRVCCTSMDFPQSQECDRIEAEIDSARDRLFGAKAIVDMCIRDAAVLKNDDAINALALVSPSLAEAAEHISQLELAMWELCKSQGVREARPVNQ